MDETEKNGSNGLAPGWSRLTEEEVRELEEVEWANQDPDVRREYADQLVAVYGHKIIAHGEDMAEVLAEAQRITGLPKHKIPLTSIIGPRTLFAPRD
jgi:hypothetical protein